MAKTPSKRKAEAVTFEDDNDSSSSSDDADNDNGGAGASNNDGEEHDDGDAPMADATATAAAAAKTPRATSAQGKRTPGSSGGMTMRSGRKKKRSKSSSIIAASAAAAVAASTTDTTSTSTSTKPQRKRAKKQAKETNGGGDEKKSEGMHNSDESSDEESEDEEMNIMSDADGEHENATSKTTAATATSTATATTVKATKSPEAAREAVAMAQVTEEGDDNTNEGGEKEDTLASAAPAATSNGTTTSNNNNVGGGGGMGGGILRLVSQTLRLPSQHTPAAPASGVSASASAASSLASPVPPPPGGRRLIFTTAKKGNATTTATTTAGGGGGGRNKLLMQTRQPQQKQQQQGGTPKDKLPQSSTTAAGNEEPHSVQRTHFQQQQPPNTTTATTEEESTSSLALANLKLSNLHQYYQTDLILYTKAWFTLLLSILLVTNALTTVANGNFCSSLGRWHVKGQSVLWMEWYGFDLDTADYNTTTTPVQTIVEDAVLAVDDDDDDAVDDDNQEEDNSEDDQEEEEEEEEEIIIETITKTITVPNPTLLSTAQNQLRAHRLNLHEIDVLDQNMAELTTGLDKLNVNLKEWKEMYPEYDFEVLEGEEGEIVVSSSGIVKRLGGGGSGERKEEGGDGDEMAKALVLEEISSSDVVIFCKSFYCPHCKATRKLFQRLSTNSGTTTNFDIRVIELDGLPNGEEIQSMLYQLTDQKTEPTIFVKGRHVGGNDDVQVAAKSGDLEELLILDMVEFEPITHPDSGYSSGEEGEIKERAKKPMYNKIDDIKFDIAKKQTLLAEWERVLLGAEEILELLDKGEISPTEVNAVMDALARVSMLKGVAASVLDGEQITLPGEGCEGVDYVPLNIDIEEVDVEEDGDDDAIEEEADVELQEEDAIEGDIVEVVGAIDVDALDVASDVPVRLEDAQSVYESLLRLSQTTSEALLGESGLSSYAEKWVQQIIQEELHEKEVDVDPPPVEEVHAPLVAPEKIVTKEESSSSSAGGDYSMLYTAGNAVRDIDRLFEMEDADRTGKFDYASIVNGARVLRRGPYATSYSYYETLPLFNRFLAMAKLRFYGHPPEVALLPNTGSKHTRGQCWSFPSEFDSSRSRRQANDATNDGIRGEYATLTVSLASAISVTEVIIEHIPPMISSNPPTAIRNFRVVGFEDGGAYGEPWELGTYTFSIGPSLTSFTIPTILDGQNVPKLKSIAIAIDSNNGAEYACLYRVRVHGA